MGNKEIFITFKVSFDVYLFAVLTSFLVPFFTQFLLLENDYRSAL